MPNDTPRPETTLCGLPRPIRDAVSRFKRHPVVRREALNTPSGANGMCGWASAVFARMCPMATPLDVQGSLINFLEPDSGENGGVAWHSRIGQWESACHTVTRAGRWYFDWTARQFDPSAPWPVVMTERELRRRWMIVGRNAQ